MPKRNNNPFDLRLLEKNAMKDNFGFSIESSFVQGPSNKQKKNISARKKYENIRYQQIKTGATEPFEPSEITNVYGAYRND